MLAAIVLVALHLLATTEAVNFYKCPAEAKEFPIIGDDTASGPITLTPSIPFHGGYYNTAYVGRNGIVQFQTPPASTNKETIGVFPVAGSIFVAPFYSDLAQVGDVTWCYSNETEQIKQQIRRNFTSFSSLEFAIIATWNNIGYYNDSPALRNTFQCVIATDGSTSFALFLYDKLQWSEANPAHVGFNNGTGDACWEMPCSGSEGIESLTDTSNVGVDGLWLFRIDEEIIDPSFNEGFCIRGLNCSCPTYSPNLTCTCTEPEDQSCTESSITVSSKPVPTAVIPVIPPGPVTPNSRAVAIAVPIVLVTLLLVGVCVLAIVLFCIYIRIRIKKYVDLFVFRCY